MTTHSSDNFEIIDITKDRSIDSLWFSTLEEISQGSDKLKNNYKEIDLSTFISFYVAVDQNKILGFSGLQYMPNRWGSKIARCMSRFYLRPDSRHGYSLFQKPLLTETILPIQIKDARTTDLDVVFMSREKGRSSFKKSVDYLRSKNSLINFLILEDRYNVCGCMEHIPESCKQYISIMYLNDLGKETWNLDMLKHRII